MDDKRSWEQMGAASGLFASLLFVVAFIIFLKTNPAGGNTPALPPAGNAEAAPAFFADNLTLIRAQVMVNAIGLSAFLWFLGTLWARMRDAEGSPARGSVIAFSGAVVGVTLTMVGLVLTGASTLSASLAQAQVVPAFYTAAAVAFAFGGGSFVVFFLGVAEVSLRAGGIPKWLGWLALLAAAASVFGFVTPYATTGIFNPATGGLGFYAHYAAVVVWVLLASIAMTLAQFRGGRAYAPAHARSSKPETSSEGAGQ
jgi:hypothetical protein